MATQGTFYLDAPSLATATVIYTDAELTTVAPDGFYSNGTIVREQASGVLLPQTTCPSCVTPCGGSISASGAQGVYYLDTDLGEDTGAVIVQFDPINVPDGILATLGTTSYNGLSSALVGWLQATVPNLPTFIGDSGANCGVPDDSPYVLDEFEYGGSAFSPLGTTKSVDVIAGQMQLTAGAPGTCIMVIPKTAASPSILSLEMIGPCLTTVFNINVSCPAALPSFASSSMQASSSLACESPIGETYYVAYVGGGAGVLGFYDLVFSDPNGEFKLAAGFYKTTAAGANDWFEVDANGVVVNFGTCVEGVSISLGTPDCKLNNCNDNALCAVQVPINTTSAPAGSYITLTTDLPSSTATVSIIDNNPASGRLLYSEPDGTASPVYFTLELRDSGGAIIATQSTSLTHESFWQFLASCPT